MGNSCQLCQFFKMSVGINFPHLKHKRVNDSTFEFMSKKTKSLPLLWAYSHLVNKVCIISLSNYALVYMITLFR